MIKDTLKFVARGVILIAAVIVLMAAAQQSSVTVLGLISDGTPKPMRIDDSTEAIKVIEYEHTEVHGGSSYTAHLSTSDLDDNPLRISFTTPNTTKWAHMLFYVSTTGEATFELQEAPTGGVSGGSNLTPYNHNRNSANASTLISTDDTNPGELTQGATVGTGATVLLQYEFGGGRNKVGAERRGDSEFVLLQNTKYQVNLTSGTNDIRAVLEIDWYEHTDKN